MTCHDTKGGYPACLVLRAAKGIGNGKGLLAPPEVAPPLERPCIDASEVVRQLRDDPDVRAEAPHGFQDRHVVGGRDSELHRGGGTLCRSCITAQYPAGLADQGGPLGAA